MKMNLRTILLLAGVLFIVSNPCASAHTNVTAQQARDLIESTNDLIVVDVRERYEYCGARGHIPGALNYPWSSGVLQAQYEELPTDGPVLVVCASGGRSNAAANFLDSKGFSEVYDMLRGMSVWQWETAPCKYAGGSGTANDPYQIATATDLIALGETPEDYDKHFIMTADIDLDPNLPGRKAFGKAVIAPDTNDVEELSQGISFSGVFDGNGHAIKNLKVTGDQSLGLFGHLASTASVSNLGLEAVQVRGTGLYVYVGGLVGFNRGSIVACYSTGSVSGLVYVGGLVGGNGGSIIASYSSGSVSGTYQVGGLVGLNQRSIVTSYSTAWVSGNSYVGGLVGENRGGSIVTSYSGGSVNGAWAVGGLVGGNKGSIATSYGSGSVSGTSAVGGLVGVIFYSGKSSKCYSTAAVSGADDVGGLVGINYWSVTECYSMGAVTGESNVGGLVGRNSGEAANCYSTSTVAGDNSVGGLVGWNQVRRYAGTPHGLLGLVARCYSTGVVSGRSDVGGLMGSNPDPWGNNFYGKEVVSHSFWDIQTSGQTKSAGGTGKTTAEMQAATTFLEAGWDFVDEMTNGTEDIWWILEGQSYPRLWWEYGQAFSPHPQDGAIGVIQPVLFSWVPGGSTLSYDVYFGEDEEAVADATTTTSEIYRGRQTPETTTYDPGMLELAATYYWRIDEVDEVDPNSPWKGKIWRFSTADFLVVDDFESYNDLDPDDPEFNRIFNTWIDGWGDPNNGSWVGFVEPPYVGRTIAHAGKQSMSLLYDNSAAHYSEATMTLTDLRDWTREGVGVLSLWFGDMWDSISSGNAPAPMYVALTSSGAPAAVYHEDLIATQVTTWTEWRIDLQVFANQGVDLTNINTISIGFGDKNNPQAGGSGVMYFDDIRLYRPLRQVETAPTTSGGFSKGRAIPGFGGRPLIDYLLLIIVRESSRNALASGASLCFQP